jgi:hypothetical protein
MARSSTTFDGKNFKGGRPKGSVDKVTSDAKALFMEIMEGQVPKVQEALNEVYKEDKAAFLKYLAALMPYFIPKKTDVTSNGKELNEKPIIIDWNGGSDKDTAV